jgi:CTD kinase subunit gamma
MSDPFAIRMNFKRSYLEKMTSNPASQMRAAAYAVKYREQDEDLHSCILEQLDAVWVSFLSAALQC